MSNKCSLLGEYTSIHSWLHHLRLHLCIPVLSHIYGSESHEIIFLGQITSHYVSFGALHLNIGCHCSKFWPWRTCSFLLCSDPGLEPAKESRLLLLACTSFWIQLDVPQLNAHLVLWVWFWVNFVFILKVKSSSKGKIVILGVYQRIC
jgi:hypothetical protein